MMGSTACSTALLFALLGACTVGQPPEVDASVANADRAVCEDRAGTIATAYQHSSAPAGARARAGCQDAGCHVTGGAAPSQFAFSGTVYKETAAVTPAAGVTVRIFKPGNNASLAEAVTDDAGNFIIRNPGMFTDFPYDTHVTVCGVSMNIKPMGGKIAAGDANCNAGGSCHGAGGTQGAAYIGD
ncbi:MAG TPA: hypothetical protein VNO30_45110 [Kofleriaceae bacterium]|nr:hypothetical protein [Kofleriaceae bacterium]